jgi:hypothetical protein
MNEQSTGTRDDNPLQVIQNEMIEVKKKFLMSIILMMTTGTLVLQPKQLEDLFSHNNRTHLIQRSRCNISSIFCDMDTSNSRQTYCMKAYVFDMHCDLLKPHLEPHNDDPLLINRIPNGHINHTLQISIALQYLARGQAMDIALVHGVSHATGYLIVSGWLLMPSINILNFQSIFQYHMMNNCNFLMTFVVKVRLYS